MAAYAREKRCFRRIWLERYIFDDCVAEGSQFELVVCFHLETALRGPASERNSAISAYPDLFGEIGRSNASVIGPFSAAKLAFLAETNSEKVI